MAANLSRFLKCQQKRPLWPSVEELLRCLDAPEQSDSQTCLYLAERPVLKNSLNGIVAAMVQDSRKQIALEALRRFMERAQRGASDFGRDMDDWIAAEADLSHELESDGLRFSAA